MDIRTISDDFSPPKSNHEETIVCLSNKNGRPKDYVEIGVDAEDYYRIKSSENDV